MRALGVALAVASARIAVAQNTEYEYVVIGSGPGGGPLAANLARAGHSVFLIEAGEDHGADRVQQIPLLSAQSSEGPTMSWEFFVNHYQDTDQAYRDTKYTWELENGDYYVGTSPPAGARPLGLLYPRSSTFGGCANSNAMNLVLPPDNDWNAIAELTGDASWSAQNMIPLFERLENNSYIEDSNGTAARGHGFSGWLGTNRNDIDNLATLQPGQLAHIQDLYHALGEHSPNSTEEVIELLKRDMNNIEPDRYERNDLRQTPLHYNGERRRSGPESYLRSTVNELYENGTQRYPLTISTNSLASRVLFTNDTVNGRPRATGVAYLQGQALYRADRRNTGLQRGAPHNVTASREVIVAGGTFNTPQILKLSGIGPREELEEFGIPVIVDLPAVGENLQDNYEATIMVQAAQPHGSPLQNCTLLAPGDPCLREWERNGTGPYGNAGSVGTMTFRSSVSENQDADIAFFGGAGGAQEGFFPGFSIPGHPPNTSFWSAVKMQTQNRAGTVRLRSANPQDVPEINFHYFQEGRDHDLQALAEAAEFVLNAYNSAAPPYGPYTVMKPVPGSDIRQAIMDEAYSHHATSTCVMGTSKADSCVDSRFRVHDVDGLRVVDASIFPRTPGGFPVLPIFMASEKATDVLLEDLNRNATAAERM